MTKDLRATALEQCVAMLERADCSTGYCCCGSPMEGHSIGDGHSPVDEGAYHQSNAIEQARTALAQPPSAEVQVRQVPEGYALVPIKPTEAMLKAGGHVNSEWLNDNAPIGEARYIRPMEGVYAAMLAAAALKVTP